MKFKVRVDDATAETAGTSLKDAEIAVQSSISVREQHKAKLRALLSKMAPQAGSKADTPGQTLPNAKKAVKGKTRKERQSVDTRLPEIAEGKEIHVLGDLLLLTRASSVDVVGNIQKWRAVDHQGLPRPYIYENENYLLKMCEDLNFLDQVGDLVEWLGFRLVRNPFIVTETLDDVVSSRLSRNVHEGRSLKYWSSTSWKLTKKAASKACQSNQTFNYRWKKQSPPPPLVKPLAIIRPEDDVVDGSQIANAQEVLLDEEAFHGRLLALRAIQEYVAREPSVFESTGIENNAASATIYDAISTLNSQLRSKEFALSLIRRQCTQVERSLQDLRNQMGWTELHRDCDRSKNHRVWECRNKYRQEALKTYTQLTERLERCLMLLKGDERRVGDTLDNGKERLRELRIEKEKQRAARRNGNQLNEATKLTNVRRMADKRDCKVQTKKKSLQTRSKAELDFVRESVPQNDSIINEDIAVEIQNELGVIEIRKSNGVERDLGSYDADYQLEKKRQLSIYQKRARLEQQARILEEKELLLDRRRAENVAMKWEDKLARTVEREARRNTMLKSQKARKDRVASCAMFKCMHEMNGKRFLISVYIRNARGYDLEGLRIVAYDPRSSASYTMVMTLREFYGLGYGRTSDGLGGFCKWLCLLYEKRRRQFRLVWSGTPCPPPLRVRENDQSLVCIHKEGVKLGSSFAVGYSLVAVYLRTDEQSALRFVVGSCNRHEFLLTEHIVFARWLLTGSDLDVQWKASGHAVIVWKHHADVLKMQEELCPPQNDEEASADKAVGPRIYSSEIVVKRVRYLVHLYDTDETKYAVELIPKLKRSNCGNEGTTLPPKSAGDRLSLYKRDINPYDVHLSSSSFADLLSLTHFEQSSSLELKQESSTGDDDQVICAKWKATVSPKWTNKLANYVRVLRLAKYACKVGGVFCFVVVYVVQQKTEFRAHLLLELTWLAPALSSSFSLGGEATRQSLRIALSDYLRCSNSSRRFGVGLGSTGSEGEGGDECLSCSKYDAVRAKLFANDVGSEPETTLNYSTNCSSCALIQYRRLHAIKELIIHAGAIDPQALEFIYHGYCGECSTLAPPIVLVVGSVFSTMMHWLLPLLEHYFASFNCRKPGCMTFNDGDQGHSVSDESSYMRETILQTLAQDQVVVLFNADCGVTVASANSFVHELHWWLYPHFSELPCHVAYVVGNRSDSWNDGNICKQNSARDHDLVEALQALNHAACQVAELPPVYLNDDGNEGDHASAFDAYLVAEAVLVEATRVLLHPDYAWQKPRKIVGASSWSTACSYLLDPVRLSADLQRCDLLGIGAASVAILEAYFAHAKWPRDYPDVRPVFYGLLAFMLHVQHVCHIAGMRSGSLQSTSSRHDGNEDGMAAELEVLAESTSVIDCSALSTTMETSCRGDFNGGKVQDTLSTRWL